MERLRDDLYGRLFYSKLYSVMNWMTGYCKLNEDWDDKLVAMKFINQRILLFGLIVLLNACSNTENVGTTIPTLPVSPNIETSPEVTQDLSIQSGVDQLFTQTAQAQTLVAPTQLVIAAFNVALTATAIASQIPPSMRAPLEIALIPDAEYWGMSEQRETSRNVFYLTADSPEVVVRYYQQKLVEHYMDPDASCVRFPAVGNAPNSDSDMRVAPFIYRCMFDNSRFNFVQFTQVEIYPGRPNENPELDAEGFTIIKYAEQWMQ